MKYMCKSHANFLLLGKSLFESLSLFYLSLCWCIPFSLRAKVESNKFSMDIRTQGYTLGHKKIGSEKVDIGKMGRYWREVYRLGVTGNCNPAAVVRNIQ